MKANDIVKLENPEVGEENERYTVLEINGDRGMFQLVCDWTVKPVFNLPIRFFEPAN